MPNAPRAKAEQGSKGDTAMATNLVVGPVSMPDWLEKRKRVFGELDRQLIVGIREPGKGLSLDDLQLVVEHRNPFGEKVAKATIPPGFCDVQGVIKLLGRARVVTARRSARVRRLPVPKNAIFLVPREAVLQMARENEVGTHSWYLGYYHGQSIEEERENFGMTASDTRPCFWRSGLDPVGTTWGKEALAPAGYYFLDYGPGDQGRFSSTSWTRQTEKVVALGAGIKRADERVVIGITNDLLLVHRLRLMISWVHWGFSQAPGGHRICVGDFDRSGWNVFDYHPDWGGNDSRRVVVSREFPTA